MQELIEKLIKGHGLTAEQSYGVLNTIKDFIVEKFPMAGGMLDNFFPAEADQQQSTNTDKAQTIAGGAASGDIGTTEGPALKGGSILDTQSGTSGQSGEKEHSLNEMVNTGKKN